MVANRLIQLDHQTRGRLMIGFGPGVLPEDAYQMGIDPMVQRNRMAEAIDVIVRLFKGERITHRSDWFELVNACCHNLPYSRPYPEIAVASVATPSGGKLAGKYGFSMLCLAATQKAAFDALETNWTIATEMAAENGHVMSRDGLRLVAPVHIAATRAQARENIKFGFERWINYFNTVSPVGYSTADAKGDPIDYLIEQGTIMVGTPDDAIAMMDRIREKQGGFGCFLHNAHNWADTEATKRSYELWQRYVMPVVNGANAQRSIAFDHAGNPAVTKDLFANSKRATEAAFASR
jgi:limonene 1,2-monooxygenase